MPIDEHALVSEDADVASDATIWAFTQVREGARIGARTSVGSHSYIDADVVIGSDCKIQSGALIFKGAVLEDGVFVGPGAVITNDLYPRAVNADGSRKGVADWTVTATQVRTGASLGSRCVLVAGVEVGSFAMVAAGAVVTKDVAPHDLVAGVPATPKGRVCACGHPIDPQTGRCTSCQRQLDS